MSERLGGRRRGPRVRRGLHHLPAGVRPLLAVLDRPRGRRACRRIAAASPPNIRRCRSATALRPTPSPTPGVGGAVSI